MNQLDILAGGLVSRILGMPAEQDRAVSNRAMAEAVLGAGNPLLDAVAPQPSTWLPTGQGDAFQLDAAGRRNIPIVSPVLRGIGVIGDTAGKMLGVQPNAPRLDLNTLVGLQSLTHKAKAAENFVNPKAQAAARAGQFKLAERLEQEGGGIVPKTEGELTGRLARLRVTDPTNPQIKELEEQIRLWQGIRQGNTYAGQSHADRLRDVNAVEDDARARARASEGRSESDALQRARDEERQRREEQQRRDLEQRGLDALTPGGRTAPPVAPVPVPPPAGAPMGAPSSGVRPIGYTPTAEPPMSAHGPATSPVPGMVPNNLSVGTATFTNADQATPELRAAAQSFFPGRVWEQLDASEMQFVRNEAARVGPVGLTGIAIAARQANLDPTRLREWSGEEATRVQQEIEKNQAALDAASTRARLASEPVPAPERDAITNMRIYRDLAHRLRTEFKPEQLARYAGVVNMPAGQVRSLFITDDDFNRFQAIVGALGMARFGAGGKNLTDTEKVVVEESIPTATEWGGGPQFVTKLDQYVTSVDKLINARLDALGPREEYVDQLRAQYGPTTTTTTTTLPQDGSNADFDAFLKSRGY